MKVKLEGLKSMRMESIRQSPLFSVILILGLLWGFELSLSSCASKSSPSGGPRDTLAPQLDTAFPPNKSLHFSAQKIVLEFDEYLKLKSPQQQININPLLGEDLEVISRGKSLEIRLDDSLRANTTYIISFGNSLADLNEGNENKNFKYVFSTGDYLDSLRLSGRLKRAYSNEPLGNYLVALYDLNKLEKRDSFLIKERPDYYAYSDESGSFGLAYLGEGDYLMAAFEDKGGTFKLANKNADLGFVSDTIRLGPDSLYRYDFSVYSPEQAFRFYGGRQKSKGHIQFAFNQPVDSFRIESVEPHEDSSFFFWNEERDTLNYYFSFSRDSLQFSLDYDTLFVDSVITVRLREMDPDPIRVSALKSKIRPWDTIVLKTSVILKKWHKDSIFSFSDVDTNNLALTADSTNPFRWWILPPHKRSFRLRFKTGALESADQALEDSLDLKFAVLKGEALGSLSFKVKADSGKAMILQILESDGQPLLERSFRDSTLVNFKNVIARKLQAFLIIDRDGNGEYTTGDFELNRQPEERLKYLEEIEVRENWELDLEWHYQKQAAINKEPLLNQDSIPPAE